MDITKECVRKRAKKGLLTKVVYAILISTVVLIGTFTYYYKAIASAAETGVYSNVKEAPKMTAAIVLGARVYSDGSVSPVLADRLTTGAELYKAGKVDKILLTGDHGQKDYDEVNAMRKFILDMGVPEEDVFMDHAGFSTYDSMYRAKNIFKVEDALIVTQQFHLARALYIARELGIEAGGIEADKRQYVGAEYLEFREVLARIKALLQIHILKSEPKYLGEVIPINGDGRVTLDQI